MKANELKGVPGMSIEEIKALFFDRAALREPSYRVYQLNQEGYRLYYRFVDGEPEFYPSVTTVLRQVMPMSPGLLDWIVANGKEGAAEKRDTAAAYGTFMHAQFETLIINRRYDFDAVPELVASYIQKENLPEKLFGEWLVKIRKDVLAFAQFVKDFNVRPLAVEIGLVHPVYHYAGCIDLPCVMTVKGKDVTAIVDFKSGRKGFFEEHELQLHMYREMWNANFDDVRIERLYNFSPKDWRTKPTYNLKDQTDSPNAAKLPHLLALAGIEDGKREKEFTVIRGVLDLDNGEIFDNVLSLSLSDLVKSRAQEEAPSESAVPELEKPVKGAKKAGTAAKAPKKPVNRTKAAGTSKPTSKPRKSVKSKIEEK